MCVIQHHIDLRATVLTTDEYVTQCINAYSYVDTKLAVAVPPEVSVSATQTRIAVGQSTTLTCSVDRSNPSDITYTWSFTDTSGATTILSGETGQTLQLSDIAENEFGTYTCNATNSASLNGTTNIAIERGCKTVAPVMH